MAHAGRFFVASGMVASVVGSRFLSCLGGVVKAEQKVLQPVAMQLTKGEEIAPDMVRICA